MYVSLLDLSGFGIYYHDPYYIIISVIIQLNSNIYYLVYSTHNIL